MGAPDTAAIDAFRLVDRIWAQHFSPRPIAAVDEWADEHRILPRGSAEAGPWRTERTPFARQIYRDLSDDAPYEDIVLMCATQLLKSECGLNWIGSIIDQTPGPVMIVQATVDTAKRYSKQRVGPMIAACPTLRDKVKDARSRDSGNTVLMKEFPGGALVITGANSAAGLASMPARFIHFDERDDYPDDVDGQGEPTKIARARQDTYRRRKRLTSSSPKRAKGDSRIESDYLAGTQFEYHVPCPHCDELQVLVWANLQWVKEPETDPDSAAYACRCCGTLIAEHHKDWMFARGQWIARNPEAIVRSYHLSSLYSPLGWLSWPDMVREYIDAIEARDRGDEDIYKAFVNTRLAETWQEQAEELAANELQSGAEDFPLGTVPMGGLVVVAAVDVQDDRFELAAWAFGERDEMWLFDYVVLPANPGHEGDWNKLDALLQMRYPHAGGQTLGIEASAIDTGGHYTHDVYNFVRRIPSWRKVSAIKGADRPGMPVMGRKPSMVDVNWRGGILKHGVKLWHVGVNSAKDLLFGRLKRPGQVHLSKHLPPAVFTQLTAEHRIRARTAHGFRSVWKPRKAGMRNEAWDLAVYAVWCGERLGVSKWPAKIWQQLRERITPDTPDMFSMDTVGPVGPFPEATPSSTVALKVPAPQLGTAVAGRVETPSERAVPAASQYTEAQVRAADAVDAAALPVTGTIPATLVQTPAIVRTQPSPEFVVYQAAESE